MSFDRIAPSYRSLEWIAFAGVLQRARTAFISQAVDSRCALLAGEGNGRFLAELLQRNPRIQVDYIDASRKMLRIAERRAAVISSKARDRTNIHSGFARSRGPNSPQDESVRVADRTGAVCAPEDDTSFGLAERSRVKFHHADILDWIPPRSYDLIITHFFLDCFNHERLLHVIAKLARSAAPRSHWLLSDFANPPNGFRDVHAKIWLRAMYLFFRAVADLQADELVDPSSLIQETGFQLRRETVMRLGLVRSQLWERIA